MGFTVTIFGRPNVGKSSLFNKLVGEKKSLVADIAGVTRDWIQSEAKLFDLKFNLIDTAGFMEDNIDVLSNDILNQSKKALDLSDLIIFLTDAREGLIPEDQYLARWLNKQLNHKDTDIIVVANKAENFDKVESNIYEFYKLGFGDPMALSVEHNLGFSELYQALRSYASKFKEKYQSIEIAEDEEDNQGPLQIAIVGKPNSGKSTYLNKIIGEERSLTGEEAGITRDAISVDFSYKETKLRLVDTAGIRRRNKITEIIEKKSYEASLKSIRFAHIVLLMIDATHPLEKQDMHIASHVIEEGRGLIIVINKCDLIDDVSALKKEIKHLLNYQLSQVKDVPLCFISALSKKNIHEPISKAIDLYDLWKIRISTGKLNNWLQEAQEIHTAPLGPRGKRLKIKYITQGKKRPPTFYLFTTQPQHMPKTYLRYLTNSLREKFKLAGVPIRFVLRKSDNPYSD